MCCGSNPVFSGFSFRPLAGEVWGVGGTVFIMAPTSVDGAVPHLMLQNCSVQNMSQVGSKPHCCTNEADQGWSVALGISMGIVGSVLINVGQNLQAKAMQSSPQVRAKTCSPRISRTSFPLYSHALPIALPR